MAIIIRLVAAFFLLWLFIRLIKGVARKIASIGQAFEPKKQERIAEMVRDPQCGSYVSMEHAVKAEKDGQRHFFCSDECAQKYTGAA